MTKTELLDRIAAWPAPFAASDYEEEHIAYDEMLVMALSYISEGGEDAAEVAKAALDRVDEETRSRWWYA